TKEISLAVTATTLSLVVIFLPVAFMGGLVGKFWNSFGLTATYAILVSLVIAFTLTPMLAARILSGGGSTPGHGAASKESGVYHRLEVLCERVLGWCLRHRFVSMMVTVGILVSGFVLLKSTPLEFVVDDDMSEFEIVAEAPPGSSLARSADITRAMEAQIRTVLEVTALFSTIGVRGQDQSNVTDISIYVGLTPLAQRQRSHQKLMQEVREKLAIFPGLRVSVQQINLISGGGFRQTPFNLILRGPDLGRLEQYAGGVIQQLKAQTGFVDLDTSQALRQPQGPVHIHRP